MIKEDVIFKDLIFLDEELDEKESIIDFILNKAYEKRIISEVNKLRQAVIERENEISTAIGFDIAMPHGKSATVLQPFIAFLRTAEEFHWSEENKEKVRLIFLIAVPSENTNNMHLKFISQVSKKLLDDSFRESLLIEEDNNKVYELLKSIQKD